MARPIALLLVLAVGNFLYVLDRNVMSLFMPVIRDDLTLSATQQGLVLGLAFILVLSFVAIPIARVTDRIGSRHVIAGSLFVWSFATFITGFATSFGQIFGARMVVGAGEAGFTPAVHAALALMFSPKHLGRALAIFILGTSAGQVLGFYASGSLANVIGWRGGFHVLGGAGIALAFVVWFVWPYLFRQQAESASTDKRAEEKKIVDEVSRGLTALPQHSFLRWAVAEMIVAGRTLKALLKVPGFTFLVLAAMAHSVAAFAVQQSMPTFLHDHYNMEMKDVGLWMGPVFSMAAVAGTLSMGFIIDFFKVETKLKTCLKVSGISVVATVPLYAIGLVWPEIGGLWIFVPAFFLSSLYYAPTYFVLQNLTTSENRASANALLITGFQIAGLGLGPTLVGISTDALGSFGIGEALAISMAVVAGLNIVSGYFFFRTRATIIKTAS
ncbi:MAG: MFS transporter [Rhodospirillaceae bacterium]|nr:MFS transporter [Rhodospirillaceae bacterium]